MAASGDAPPDCHLFQIKSINCGMSLLKASSPFPSFRRDVPTWSSLLSTFSEEPAIKTPCGLVALRDFQICSGAWRKSQRFRPDDTSFVVSKVMQFSPESILEGPTPRPPEFARLLAQMGERNRMLLLGLAQQMARRIREQ
jgi:hypothetical protein